MGWTGISMNETIMKNGIIDRKTTLDEIMGDDNFPILYSAMKNTTYYAAIKDIKKNIVFGMVILTAINNDNGYKTFCYKEMDETMGPFYYDCPLKILNLLTETSNEEALNWREKCKDNFLYNKQIAKHVPIKYTIPFDFDGYKEGEKILLKWREATAHHRGYYTDGIYRYPRRYLYPENCEFVESKE